MGLKISKKKAFVLFVIRTSEIFGTLDNELSILQVEKIVTSRGRKNIIWNSLNHVNLREEIKGEYLEGRILQRGKPNALTGRFSQISMNCTKNIQVCMLSLSVFQFRLESRGA